MTMGTEPPKVGMGKPWKTSAIMTIHAFTFNRDGRFVSQNPEVFHMSNMYKLPAGD